MANVAVSWHMVELVQKAAQGHYLTPEALASVCAEPDYSNVQWEAPRPSEATKADLPSSVVAASKMHGVSPIMYGTQGKLERE